MRLHEDHNSKACVLNTVRQAVVAEGHGPTSLAAYMGITEGYISRVLNGESGLGTRFIMSLPKPVLRRLAQMWCEYYGGVVVWPAVSKEEALRQKVASLEFENRQLKAEMPVAERKVG